uniref:Transposase Tc1-like domain-containing protein n=1 Tax=Cyprinus carpio carpio TaxID=630221 RepID=A0A9J8APT3_CYPCA
MGRLVRDDSKATVTQITTRYNQGMQNTISECTTRQTLKQMGYSSRRPHRVPLLSAKSRKRRLQFVQAHQNGTIEDWKNVAWSNESRFLLRHSDGRVRIWRKEHENMDPSCLVSTVQAGGGGGVMVWGIISWHTLGPLLPIEHILNATAYLSIVADHVHPFMTTVYPSSDSYFQQYNAPCHKAQIILDWFLEHDNEFTLLKWPPQSPDLKQIEQLWDVVEWEIHIKDVQLTNLQQLRDAIMSIWTKISEEYTERSKLSVAILVYIQGCRSVTLCAVHSCHCLGLFVGSLSPSLSLESHAERWKSRHPYTSNPH